MATKKNYFEKQLSLSHKEIKGKRAKLHAEDANRASEDFIRNLTDKERALERKLMDLEDFHVNSSTSLKVTNEEFSAGYWVEQINEVTFRLEVLRQRIQISRDLHSKFFEV